MANKKLDPDTLVRSIGGEAFERLLSPENPGCNESDGALKYKVGNSDAVIVISEEDLQRFREEKAARNAQEKINHQRIHPPRDKSQTAKPAPSPITAAELGSKVFEPLRWAIPGILPEGVSLLVGSPKIGKSWVVLDWCLAVAYGGVAFSSIHVPQGESLYLALEDNERRMQRRLRSRQPDSPLPHEMHIEFNWPRINEGGIDHLTGWLGVHPRCRLVAIDTLSRFRPPNKTNGGVYEQDNAVGSALLSVAAKFQCAIVLVHHNNKSQSEDILDTISGSQGLSGGVDNILIMKRARFTKGAELHVTGRDIEDEAIYALSFDQTTGLWSIEGSGREVTLSPEKRNIINIVRSHGPISGKDLTGIIYPPPIERDSKEWQTVRKHLRDLVGGGFICKDKSGLFSLYKNNSSSSSNTSNTGNTSNAGNTSNTGDVLPQTGCVTGVLPGGSNTLNPMNDNGFIGVLGGCVTGVTDTYPFDRNPLIFENCDDECVTDDVLPVTHDPVTHYGQSGDFDEPPLPDPEFYDWHSHKEGEPD